MCEENTDAYVHTLTLTHTLYRAVLVGGVARARSAWPLTYQDNWHYSPIVAILWGNLGSGGGTKVAS